MSSTASVMRIVDQFLLKWIRICALVSYDPTALSKDSPQVIVRIYLKAILLNLYST